MASTVTSLALFALVPQILIPQPPNGGNPDDANTWEQCAGPWSEDAPPAPGPPIVPEEWLVPEDTASATDGALWKRFVLEARSRAEIDEGWVERSAGGDARWALTTIDRDADEVRMARLTGAEVLFVNGEPFVGDPQRRGFRGVPVALRTGTNTLLVGGIAGSFELELWTPKTRTVLGEWDVEWPQALPLEEVTYAVFNASTLPLRGLHVHYGHAVIADENIAPVVDEWRDGGHVLPLGVLVTGHWFRDWFDAQSPGIGRGAEVAFPVSVFGPGDTRADRRVVRGRIPAKGEPPQFPGRLSSAAHTGIFNRVSRHTSFEQGMVFGPSRDAGTLVVYGTQGPPQEAAALLARVRFDIQRLWYRTRFTPEAISDVDFLERLASEEPGTRGIWTVSPPPKHPWTLQHEMILYGNADTNAAWSHFIPEDCPIEVRSGSLTGPGLSLEGDDITGWFLHRRADIPTAGPVAVMCDTGARGALLGAYVGSILHTSPEVEFAFFNSEGLEHTHPRQLAKGLFEHDGKLTLK